MEKRKNFLIDGVTLEVGGSNESFQMIPWHDLQEMTSLTIRYKFGLRQYQDNRMYELNLSTLVSTLSRLQTIVIESATHYESQIVMLQLADIPLNSSCTSNLQTISLRKLSFGQKQRLVHVQRLFHILQTACSKLQSIEITECLGITPIQAFLGCHNITSLKSFVFSNHRDNAQFVEEESSLSFESTKCHLQSIELTGIRYDLHHILHSSTHLDNTFSE